MFKSLKTNDGTLTLFSEKFQETYHSRHGAMTESIHVFIENGLKFWASQQPVTNGTNHDKVIVKVGEIGFGSGINAMLSFQFAQRNQIRIEYAAIEAYPISESSKLDLLAEYQSFDSDVFSKILNQSQAQKIEINPNFSFVWFEEKWPETNPFSDLDVLFYDAFSPNTQPEMWDEKAMQTAFDCLKSGGILVTYSAKGYVRRNLITAGFKVERLPGPPGKFEMLRGLKS